MFEIGEQEQTDPSALVSRLPRETRAARTTLDAKLGVLDLGNPGDYQVFLQVQLAARSGVEAWLRTHAQEGWAPPCQTQLIARDIMKLGMKPLATAPEFRPRDVHWLGVAYVVARSSTDNRTILARLDDGASPQAAAYLADSAMSAYWRSLGARLAAVPAAVADAAVKGANAALHHFTACAAALIDRPGVYAA